MKGITAVIIGIASLVNALPANSGDQGSAASSLTSRSQSSPDNSQYLQLVRPKKPKDGSILHFNGTTIHVKIKQPPQIPKKPTWRTDFSNSSSEDQDAKHNPPDKRSGRRSGARGRGQRHLPYGSRTGRQDTYNGVRGRWINEVAFEEGFIRPGEAQPLVILVQDYQRMPDMAATRMAYRRSELDERQFPDYVDSQTPMTRLSDTRQARLDSGNANRPNNEWFNTQLGIGYPPYTADDPELRTGRRLQDEEAHAASMGAYDPSRPLAAPQHVFANQQEQAYQGSVYAQAPRGRPILEGFENMPDNDFDMADLEQRIEYARANGWEYDPGTREYYEVYEEDGVPDEPAYWNPQPSTSRGRGGNHPYYPFNPHQQMPPRGGGPSRNGG